MTLRLVAGGAEARQTLTVAAVPPRVLALSVPPRVKQGATRVTVRVRVSAPMTFTAAGRTIRLRRAQTRSRSRSQATRHRRPAIPIKLGDTRSELLVTRT